MSTAVPAILPAEVEIHPGEHPTGHFLGMTWNLDTIWVTVVAGLIVILLGFWVRGQLTKKTEDEVPTKLQLVWETIVKEVETQVEENLGRVHPYVVPLAVALFFFILIANWIEVIPTEPNKHIHLLPSPTADTNLTYAMGAIAMVSVWVYGTRAAYEKAREDFGPRESTAGDLSFYDGENRAIWFCAEGGGVGSLGHETVHALLQNYGDGDFPHAPVWLSEGLAALFEVVTYDDKTGDAQFGPHFRIVTLRKALQRTDYAPKVSLEHLFTLRDDDSFKKDRALGYALARETLRIMYEKHGDALWRFYRGWRDGLLTDPTGEHAFAAAMDGKTPADVTPEFLAWVQSSESGLL